MRLQSLQLSGSPHVSCGSWRCKNTNVFLESSRLEEEEPSDWWAKLVPQVVHDNANKNRTREIESGVTPRSADLIDYTTFGELGEIIKANWALFSDTFSDIKAVENTLARLNTLRAPIAHCAVLADDEVVRLRLSLRDWFRLME